MARQIQESPKLFSFPPIAGHDARVLVLGTMPSVASLAARQYYAHPRNAFWPIMGQLFGSGPELPYDERTRLLITRRVAVWDVLRECKRPGSLDSAIQADSECAHDFPNFFAEHRGITHVFFNGTKAESAYRRHVVGRLADFERPIAYARLPSTSPAHAGRRFEEKLAAWQAVKDALDRLEQR
jgi:hypoxanthine-DNA glycosylase